MWTRSTIATLFAALAFSASATAAFAQAQDTIPASVRDLNQAQLIEVRDSSGQILLHGTLKTSSNSTKETKRKAELDSPSGQEAKGKVEVEIERKDGLVSEDEFEIEVERLPGMATFEVLLDGQRIGSFVTNRKGKAELDLSRKFSSGR